MIINNKVTLAVVTATTLLVSACGGSSDSADSNPPTTETPEVEAPETETPEVETPESITENVPDENGNVSPTLVDGNASDWQFIPERSDEFNSASLDTTKWENDPEDFGPWSWRPENVKITDDGKLRLTMDYEEHTAQRWGKTDGVNARVDVDMFYTSGMIRVNSVQTYGYYEAKIRGTHTFPGNSPAFWVYSNGQDRAAAGMNPTKEGDPIYSEVDFVELQQAEYSDVTGVQKQDSAEIIDMNLHAIYQDEHGDPVEVRPHNNLQHLSQNKIIADFDPRDDFHIYGTEISEDYVIWYIDGEEVARKANLYWHLPMRVTLSLGLRTPHVTYNNCPNNLPRCPVADNATQTGYPTNMDVDWVRVYKRAP
ncbi:family 16 glycosylhydrolase [Colwellia echini]|uniref:Family 16 glycosylhydrolase n=1 Tax=Colwellia echini TaxID=1982103 RepID=A0ABY3MYL2_9GAMM|nr:family 16 glycosylhydrolase [Colwellia echini]TYK66269.1 family 16 glycosylhydrolase [Colwellia echini]